MNATSAVILAAGKGTRMRSELPKVAHEVAGRPMIDWVVRACADAGCARIVVVVGHGQDLIRDLVDQPGVEFAIQSEQLGTGHAVRCTEPLFETEKRDPGNPIVVLAGDGPLIRADTVRSLIDRHRSSGAAATLATSIVPDPTGYGRIVRDELGRFRAIVEHDRASADQLELREINPSYYCMDARALFETLARVPRTEESGEYYVTDVPALLLDQGASVEVIEAVPPEDVLSINTPAQLAEVDRILRERIASNGTHSLGSLANGADQ